MSLELTRRRMLFGSIAGMGTVLPLPFLDMLLDTNGTAFAATGAPLPTRFGTWLWGLGLVPDRWVPPAAKELQMTLDLQPLAPFKDKLNVLSGYTIPLDGASNNPHDTGVVAMRTGAATATGTNLATLDVLIADKIAKGTRFSSIEIACTNNRSVTYSARTPTTPNPSEIDPVGLYNRLFGPGFTDPNKGEFVPDVTTILQKSVLSSVGEQRRALLRQVGAADRARLDQYFTSLRQVEDQLALQLQKPAPAEACTVAAKPAAVQQSTETDQVVALHKTMVSLRALGLACNQTKVFNVAMTESGSPLRMPNDVTAYHQLTHEEPVDPTLKYQPKCSKFVVRCMDAMHDLYAALDGIKEGDGTLLDHSLILAHSDVSNAKTHDINNIPVIIAGKAGGKVRTGQHIMGGGEPVSQIGLTLQQAMGISAASWGTKSMETQKTISALYT